MSRTMRGIAIALAVIELVLAPLALFFAAMGIMMFDAPGSENNQMLWVTLGAAWLWPVALVIGAGFEIWAAVSQSERRMLIGLILPLIPLAALIVAIAASGI